MKFIVFAHSLAGKTTAANKHPDIFVDPEVEPPQALADDEWLGKYWEWKSRESDWKNSRDVKLRDERNEAYNALTKLVIMSDAPVVLCHYNAANVAVARKAGRTALFVRLEWDEITNRVTKMLDDAGNDVEELKKIAFRCVASYGFCYVDVG